MQQVQGGKFSRALQRYFGTQGKLSLLLDSVVVPTILVGDVSDEAEGRPAQGLISVGAGGAGNRSECQIGLPNAVAGQSGLEMQVLRIGYRPGANSQLLIGRTPGLPAAPFTGAKAWRDTGLQGFPAALIQGKNATPFTPGFTAVEAVYSTTTQTAFIDLDWSIVTGDTRGIMLRPDLDNVGFTISFQWLEIPPR